MSLSMSLSLTADEDFLRGLHRNAVTVVRITGDVLHIGGDVVYGSDHVTGGVLTHQMPAHVQRNGWCRIAQCQAQDGHRSALGHNVIRMNGGWLVQCSTNTHW